MLYTGAMLGGEEFTGLLIVAHLNSWESPSAFITLTVIACMCILLLATLNTNVYLCDCDRKIGENICLL